MSDPRPPHPRLFTVEEADALLPQLRVLLRSLKESQARLLAAEAELAERGGGSARSNGHVHPDGERDRLRQTVTEAQEQLTHAVRGIAELGCELKDPERGMIDFRTMREGRVVYFCWLMDEPRVLFWHELDAGFRGRQPLSE
jgi:hypothetical protein